MATRTVTSGVSARASKGTAAILDPGRIGKAPPVVSGDEREQMIREAAYFHAERRAFAAGRELEDWLTAEREIDGEMAQSAASPGPQRYSSSRPLK